MNAQISRNQVARVVNLDVGPPPATIRSNDRDLHSPIVGLEDPPDGGRRAVTQAGLVATGKQRRRLAAEGYGSSVGHRVDAHVLSVEQSSRNHPTDRRLAHPRDEQLPARDPAPL